MSVHPIADGVYHAPITLFIGRRGELLAHLTSIYARKFNRTIYRDAVAMCFDVEIKHPTIPETKRNDWWIWLQSFDGSVKAIGTLAHECYHAAGMILDNRGVKRDDEDEAGAYFFEMLLTSCLDALAVKQCSPTGG